MANTTLNDRALVRLSGEDVPGFLQGLVTNDVTGNLPVWAGLLTPQGKVLFDFLIWGDEDDLLIDVERDAVDDLNKRLTLYCVPRGLSISAQAGITLHWGLFCNPRATDPRVADLRQHCAGRTS